MLDKRIAGGLGLIGAAVATGEIQAHTDALPDPVVAVLFYGLFFGGCALLVAGWRSLRRNSEQTAQPLAGRPVKLAVLPNVPLAELWQQRLDEAGIGAAVSGTLLGSPSVPVALLVGEHDLDRARELFPELQESPR